MTQETPADRERRYQVVVCRGFDMTDPEHEKVEASFDDRAQAEECVARWQGREGVLIAWIYDSARWQLFIWSDRSDLTPDERAGHIVRTGVVGEDMARHLVERLTETAEPHEYYGYEFQGFVAWSRIAEEVTA